MSTVMEQERGIEAALALARHLRAYPQDAERAPEELAKRFGLDAEFVQEVLGSLQLREQDLGPGAFLRSLGWVQKVWYQFGKWFDRISGRSVLFVGVTTGIAAITTVILSLIFQESSSSSLKEANLAALLIQSLVTFGVWFLMLLAQGLCYWRQAQVRFPLLGALVSWLIVSVLGVVGLWVSSTNKASLDLFIEQMMVAVGFFMLFVVYACFGSALAVLSGYTRVLRKERRESRLSRQDLINRLFQIQEQLAKPVEEPAEERPSFFSKLVNSYQRFPALVALGVGFVWTILTNALLAWLQTYNWEELSMRTLTALLSIVSMFLGTLLLYVIFGYFAKRMLHALVAVTLLSAESLALQYAAGLGDFSWVSRGFLLGDWGLIISGFGFSVAITALAQMGAIMERRARKERRLNANEPDALLAELVRIQWILAPSSHMVCVMSVDVAGSTKMKADADPLKVEWSFREYHRLLEGIAARFGGRVYSTAGDGAVLEFSSCAQAFVAARVVHTELEDFNRTVNRLSTPFRVRIGINIDKIEGSLGDIEFTEVIDIASALQKHGPVGGIILTAKAAEHLQGERLAELKDSFEGQSVYVALQPTA